MGRGDRKTKKGKIKAHSHGNKRPKGAGNKITPAAAASKAKAAKPAKKK